MRGKKKWTSATAGGGGGGDGSVVQLRHERALDDDILGSKRGDLAVEKRAADKAAKRRRRAAASADAATAATSAVGDEARTAKRIRQRALEQREEEETREQDELDAARQLDQRIWDGMDDDDSVVEEDDYPPDYDYLDAEEITEADEEALAMFSGGFEPRQTLADLILAKIDERDRLREQQDAGMDPAQSHGGPHAINPQVAEICEGIAEVMHLYKSGKVPKAFKVIPALSNWEDIMYLTRPDQWSDNAMFVATRLFASNLDAKNAHKFYLDVLLPRCRDDMAENKNLNVHLYNSLKKACYKPDAFFKGIVFPLCEQGGTLREATVFASVISKMSIPVLHSAAALYKLTQLPFSGTNSLFIRALLDKKYALPYTVVDRVVEFFTQMEHDPRTLPVLWHQCLLTFAQRYKTQILKTQKEQLKTLLRAKNHHQITPDIRLELFSARSRGDVKDPDANTIAMEISAAAEGRQETTNGTRSTEEKRNNGLSTCIP